MYYNKALIIGNITRDPELKSLPSGSQVASFSVATNRVWKDKNGAKQESVDFHNIVVFGKQAETIAQYMRKGSSILVEGRLQTRSWEGPDGKKNYRTEIVADRTQFGPRIQKNQEESSQSVADKAFDEIGGEEITAEVNPDDIPF